MCINLDRFQISAKQKPPDVRGLRYTFRAAKNSSTPTALISRTRVVVVFARLASSVDVTCDRWRFAASAMEDIERAPRALRIAAPNFFSVNMLVHINEFNAFQ